jgi:hypothetical protein
VAGATPSETPRKSTNPSQALIHEDKHARHSPLGWETGLDWRYLVREAHEMIVSLSIRGGVLDGVAHLVSI